jgi:hypothetical protein
MPDSHYDRLLSDFGQLCGLPDLRFDARGLCPLHIAGWLALALRLDRRRARLLLIAGAPGAPPAEIGPHRLAALLAASLDAFADGEPLIGWQPASGLWLAALDLPEPVSAAQLLDQVAAFAQWYHVWANGPDFPLPAPAPDTPSRNGDFHARYA